MAIEIEQYEEHPAIEYKKVHLEELTIKQPHLKTESSPVIYDLTIAYRLYGDDADGNRFYTKKPVFINEPNYLAQAYIAASNGDPSLLYALQSIEIALATIIEHTGRHGTVEVK